MPNSVILNRFIERQCGAVVRVVVRIIGRKGEQYKLLLVLIGGKGSK